MDVNNLVYGDVINFTVSLYHMKKKAFKAMKYIYFDIESFFYIYGLKA